LANSAFADDSIHKRR